MISLLATVELYGIYWLVDVNSAGCCNSTCAGLGCVCKLIATIETESGRVANPTAIAVTAVAPNRNNMCTYTKMFLRSAHQVVVLRQVIARTL